MTSLCTENRAASPAPAAFSSASTPVPSNLPSLPLLPTPPTLLPDPAPQPGRPTVSSPEKLHAVCTFIRLSGLSDTAAGALAGVTASTLSRWKQKDEAVAMQLEAARAQYQIPRLEKIGEKRMNDGQLDWRAQAWLIKFSAPEVHGRPSSRRRLRDVEIPAEPEPSMTDAERVLASLAVLDAERAAGEAAWLVWRPGGLITPAMQRVQRERADAAVDAQIAAEEEELAAQAGGEAAAEEEDGGMVHAKNVAFRPEILPRPEIPNDETRRTNPDTAHARENVAFRPEMVEPWPDKPPASQSSLASSSLDEASPDSPAPSSGERTKQLGSLTSR